VAFRQLLHRILRICKPLSLILLPRAFPWIKITIDFLKREITDILRYRSKQWKTLSPTGVLEAAYTPSLSAPACPASTPGGWLVNGNVALPTLGVGVVTKVAISSQGSGVGASQMPVASVLTTTGAISGVSTGSSAPTASSSKTSSAAIKYDVSSGVGVGGLILVALQCFLL
jgi:hypothetical protein